MRYNPIYVSIKSKVMRVRCLFGKHDMFAHTLGWGKPGCLWCGKTQRTRL